MISTQKIGKKYGWALIDRNKKIVMSVKSQKEKDKWIQAITQALYEICIFLNLFNDRILYSNDLCPPESRKTNHLFLLETFSSNTVNSCEACKMLLKGLVFQVGWHGVF